MLKKTAFFLLCLLPIFGSEPIELGHYEKSLYSEYGEDGIIAKLFQLLPPKDKYLVHLGAAEGLGTSNTHLLLLQDWKGLLIDRNFENPSINLQKKFITAENINELLNSNQVPTDFELLVIDLHYNDFYIWKALDERYKPAIVVIDYNATIGPDEDKVIAYRSFYAGDKTNYFGASITALKELGNAKGYKLIYGDQSGAYLFFIREDLLSDQAFLDQNEPSKIWRQTKKQYEQDSLNRPYTTYENLRKAK